MKRESGVLDEMKKLREAPPSVPDVRVKDANVVSVEYAVPMNLGIRSGETTRQRASSPAQHSIARLISATARLRF
jgi:hypothetical protein